MRIRTCGVMMILFAVFCYLVLQIEQFYSPLTSRISMMLEHFPQVLKQFSGYFYFSLGCSCLGQNLTTSPCTWENCFAIFVCVSGLVLFASLLGNVQVGTSYSCCFSSQAGIKSLSFARLKVGHLICLWAVEKHINLLVIKSYAIFDAYFTVIWFQNLYSLGYV